MFIRTHDDSPTWQDVVTTPSVLLRWLSHDERRTPVRFMHMRVAGDLVPLVAILARPASFRAPVTQSTEVHVLFDVVTALPFPSPFAYVIAVVVDDRKEPFWALEVVPLLRVREPGREFFEEARAEAMHRFAGSFCSAERCGLVVVNETGQVLKAEIVRFDDDFRERLSEVPAVLEFLRASNQWRTRADYEAAGRSFGMTFSHVVRTSDGPLRVPGKRSRKLSELSIFRLS